MKHFSFLRWIFSSVTVNVCQMVTEKHKLNVPETMTEILDVSDEEGERKSATGFLSWFESKFTISLAKQEKHL